jgi:hypothetical protein
MTSFILLYRGPATPADASHAGWAEWFERIGDRLIDVGSPMTNGFAHRGDGTTTESAASLNGYSVVRASGRDEVLTLLRDHPYLAQGDDYAIEVCEVPRK